MFLICGVISGNHMFKGSCVWSVTTWACLVAFCQVQKET